MVDLRCRCRGMARFACLFSIGLALILTASARGDVVITLGGGVVNPPPSLTSIVPEMAVADKAALVSTVAMAPLLTSVLNAQGFTAANNWVFTFNGAALPAGAVNPVVLPTVAPNNSQFNITAYSLSLNGASTAFGETMDFTLVNPAPDPVVNGATVTRHWLQLLHEDKKYGNFGFAIAGQTGFWQVDNGDKAFAAAGDGPYYDSNAAVGKFSVPPTFHDFPNFYAGVGSYLHFTVIPTWDVAIGGKDYVIVSDVGMTWGFQIVPEPSSMISAGIGIGIVMLAGLARVRPRVAA